MAGLTPRNAATVVAMCLKRTEPSVQTMAFSNTFLVRCDAGHRVQFSFMLENFISRMKKLCTLAHGNI